MMQFHGLNSRQRLRLVLTIVTAVVALPVASLFVAGGHNMAMGATNGRIAFTKFDGTNMQIFTIQPDGTNEQQLTNDAFNSSTASWSSDGAQLVYVSDPNNDGTTQLFRMDADGSHKVQLTNDANPKGEPQWSSDGSKLIFVEQDINTFKSHIFIATANGGNIVQLTNGNNEQSPAWKPDGTSIAYTCYDGSANPQVCIMNADGTNQTAVTSGSASHSEPSWSPDGSKLAIIYEPTNYDQQLAVMNPDGTGLQAIATGDNENQTPTWSPDGTKVLYANRDNTAGDIATRAYYVSAGGGGKTAVTANDGSFAFYPSWQPVATSDMDNDGVLNTVEAAGPNGGDANGDGIPDSHQSATTSLLDGVSGSYVAVQSSCAGQSGVSAAGLPAGGFADSAFTYPAGLLSFTLACGSPNTTASVSQYFYGVTADNTLVLRKYSPTTHTYTTMPGVTISAVTIGGQPVVKASYQITDGGAFDQDGTANGTIVDPVGLAKPAVGAPNTGAGGTVYNRE